MGNITWSRSSWRPFRSERNLRIVDTYARGAEHLGVQALCFPELFVTGYCVDTGLRDRAEPVPGESTRYLESISRETGVMLVACIVETDGAALFNTAILVGPSGLMGVFRKVPLRSDEALYFKPGEDLAVYDTPISRVGLAICYDLEFPEKRWL
ncbi:MAG: nitrilase-related carbon-nitrogen hydrolase [Bacillota bacterium]